MSNRVFNSQNAHGIFQLDPLLIAMGYWFGIEVIDKFGKNPDIDATFEDVWTSGGNIDFLTSAEILEVVSDDANDTSAGTGAQEVHLIGLDNSFNEIEEDVTTNGLTIVETTKSFIRINRTHVNAVGTNGTNVGNITITSKTSAKVTSKILADEGQSQQAIFTIKAGHVGFLETAFIAVDTLNLITAQLMVRDRNPADTGHLAWRIYHEVLLTQDHITFKMTGSDSIPAKSDIRWRAKGNNPNNAVTAGFKVIIRDVGKI